MENYKVLEMIGEGSFGRVFKAEEKRSGCTVALKLIPKIGHTEREICSLRKEFKIQAELSHPNIVLLLDAFETDKELISVAEYIPGELYRLFDQYKVEMGYRRLPEQRVQEICVDLLSALHYLHSNRILHRDIKPQNILLDNQGRAKLCDFGFARNLGLNTFVLTSIKGTPLYMAPELIEEKPYDHTADIWSLGCIVYELLVGHPPFSTTSLFQLIKKIRYESIQWPAHLSAESRSFLEGVLEKETKKRLTWPQLGQHPFVREGLRLEDSSLILALTSNLTESQELAKEIQRQDKAKLLPGNSQTLIRVAQKHELEKQKLAAFQSSHGQYRKQQYSRDRRRYSDVGTGGSNILLGRHNPQLVNRRMSEAILPSMVQAQYLNPQRPLRPGLPPAAPTQYLPPAAPSQYLPPAAPSQYLTDIHQHRPLRHTFIQNAGSPFDHYRPVTAANPFLPPPPYLSAALPPQFIPAAASPFTTAAPTFATATLPFTTVAPTFLTAAPPFNTAAPTFTTAAPPFTTAAPMFATASPPFTTVASQFTTASTPFTTVASLFTTAAPPFTSPVSPFSVIEQNRRPNENVNHHTPSKTNHGPNDPKSKLSSTLKSGATLELKTTDDVGFNQTSTGGGEFIKLSSGGAVKQNDKALLPSQANTDTSLQPIKPTQSFIDNVTMKISPTTVLPELHELPEPEVPENKPEVPEDEPETDEIKPSCSVGDVAKEQKAKDRTRSDLVAPTDSTIKMVGQLATMSLDSKLVGQLATMSLDSNETIKNMENKGEDEADEDEEDGPDPEMGEWISFLDSQLVELLAELDTSRTIACINNTNFLQMVINPLRAPATLSCEVVEKILQLLSLPLSLVDRAPRDYCLFINNILSLDIVQLIIHALQSPELETGGMQEILVSFLQRMIFCSGGGALDAASQLSTLDAASVLSAMDAASLHVSTDFFNRLLISPDIDVRITALAILLKLTPMLSPSQVPDLDLLVGLVAEEEDPELLEKSILCLVALAKEFPTLKPGIRVPSQKFKVLCAPLINKLKS